MTINAANTASLLAAADTAMRAGSFGEAEALLAQLAQRQPRDFGILLRLAVVRRRCGDYTGAMDALDAALAVKPDDLPALLMRGSILKAFGRREETAKAYRKALAVAPPIDMLPPQLREEVEKGKAAIAEDDSWKERLLGVAIDVGDAASRARLQKLRDQILAGGDGPLLLDGLAVQGFYDPADFAGVAEFAAATPQILAEYMAVIQARAPELVTEHGHGATGVGTGDNASRKWSAIHLISDGEPVADNAAFAPLAIGLYQQLNPPEISGRSPNLMFSLLDPHTRIPPHHGVINTRLVIHIPLIVPPHCALRVGGDTREWVPGTALIFDDTIEHEAWNESEELRVVLLGDIWRPELDAEERRVICDLMAVV